VIERRMRRDPVADDDSGECRGIGAWPASITLANRDLGKDNPGKDDLGNA
jgi:hypothetical protein